MAYVALISAFVDDDRLSVIFSPFGDLREIHVLVLDANMRNPSLAMIIEDSAVVNRPQVLVWISPLYDLEESIPIGHRLRLHQIVLVGQRPPYVPISRQSGNYIAKITIISLCIHGGITPPVVGMEENQVCLDSKLKKIAYALLKMPKEFRVERSEIPSFREASFERMIDRFVAIEDVVFREDAETYFIER